MSIDECSHRFGNMDIYPRRCWGCGKQEDEINTERMTKILADAIPKLEQAAKVPEQPDDMPLHASTGLDSFVTRLEKALHTTRSVSTGNATVNARDLRDILYHFIRLDNQARANLRESGKDNG